MVKNKGKRSLIIALSIAGVLLVAIIAVVVINAMNSSSDDPYVQNSDKTNTSNQSTATPDEDNSKDEPAATDKPTTTDNQTTVDPATLTTVDIAPMSISVSYVKGVGGFEYEVLRAQNGTRYVQFSSAELVGTKCTNDTGVFASILASPTDAEASTLAKLIKVDDTSYGLSLADATCTADSTKLQKYQQSFSDGFAALKKIN